MTWTPERVASNTGPIIANLIEYFKAHQTEAIAWACAAAGITAPDDIAYFYDTNAGSQDRIFPNVQFLNEDEDTDYIEAGNAITYPIDLQMELAHEMAALETLAEQASILRAQAKVYMRAIESMVLNIPTATLMSGISNYTYPNVDKIRKRLGMLRGDSSIIGYVPSMRITWQFQEN